MTIYATAIPPEANERLFTGLAKSGLFLAILYSVLTIAALRVNILFDKRPE